MGTSHDSAVAEDFVKYLRGYFADVIHGEDPVEEVWDRYHLPDSTHQVNGRVLDRAEFMDMLRDLRRQMASYELYIHELTVEGRLAAARYTLGTPVLGKISYVTGAAIFAELAEDGRVARTNSLEISRFGWSGSDGGELLSSSARPAPGTSPAQPPVEGEEPTPAQDPAHYLRAYYAASYDPSVPAGEAHDRFHTLDARHQVVRKEMQRAKVLNALTSARNKGYTYPVEVHETLREGNRFAARYSTSRDGSSDRMKEVFAFGEFAPDGRVQSVRYLLEIDA